MRGCYFEKSPKLTDHKMTNRFISLVLLMMFLVGCVSPRKLEEANDKFNAADQELDVQRTRAVNAEARLNEQDVTIEDLEKRNHRLDSDTAILGASLRQITGQYDKINQLNDELLDKYNTLLSGDKSENRKLLSTLETLRISQQNDQDSLAKLRRDAEARGARLKELEDELAKKDRSMADLKARVKSALSGFEGNGLTIEERNGKLYVSLENKLLFPSGSAKVDKKGQKALTDLGLAIQAETDLEVLVEGHTDTDQMRAGSEYADNWELSVARAIGVVRILRKNSSIDPARITAAGRSQYLPLDPDDKTKNRRIEVILSPDLSGLFDLVR